MKKILNYLLFTSLFSYHTFSQAQTDYHTPPKQHTWNHDVQESIAQIDRIVSMKINVITSMMDTITTKEERAALLHYAQNLYANACAQIHELQNKTDESQVDWCIDTSIKLDDFTMPTFTINEFKDCINSIPMDSNQNRHQPIYTMQLRTRKTKNTRNCS